MEKYKCEICGKNHNIFRGIESPLPELIYKIPEEERENRIRYFNDEFCIVDEKWFLGNGYLYINLENFEEPFFFWKVWTTISTIDYQKNLEKLKNGELVELNGFLQSEIPFYTKSTGLKTKIKMQSNEEMIVEIRIAEESKIREDQSKPITEERLIEIMNMLHHNPKREERQNFDKSFNERLLNELENAEKEYIKNEKDFVINLSTGTVLFQIVSNKMLEINQVTGRGFGLHLSFDETHEESIDEIAKFRSKEYSKEFEYYLLDEIPTYQIDLGTDKRRLEKLVNQIIIDVYEEELETIETDNFEI